jgi:hypothetical protein
MTHPSQGLHLVLWAYPHKLVNNIYKHLLQSELISASQKFKVQASLFCLCNKLERI